MPSRGVFQHHVFVDFENVPSVDLSLIANLSVFVTVLVGGAQNKLDTDLVQQMLAQRIDAKARVVYGNRS